MELRKRSISALCVVLLLPGAVAVAQQILFPNFSSTANLKLNGSARTVTFSNQKVLRLTDGIRPDGSRPEASTVWFQLKQPVDKGFTTYFKFQIHGPALCCTPGDGLAFVIQNAASTDSSYGATGAGTTALGVTNGGLGYAGIPNSLAVEFDTAQNAWDPTSNHVAVQSCGTATNGPVHDPGTYTIGSNTNVTSCLLNQSQASINSTAAVPHLGVSCGSFSCQDGTVHQVVIEYTAPTETANCGHTPGFLQVYIDPPFMQGTHTPLCTAVPQINVPYNVAANLSLDGGTAWVGFTGSQPLQAQVQDVFAWEFTPHQDTTVTQTIQNGGTQTTFVYGGHVFGVTYPQGFVNTQQIQMSVDAMLINKQTFYTTRLAGTSFSNEQCVTYLETGGNCIVYRVQCQDQNGNSVVCPSEPLCTAQNTTNCINIKSSYYTSDGITSANADFLKDPTQGQNQWVELLDVQYQPNVFDGTTSGKGDSFSDFVATFKAHH